MTTAITAYLWKKLINESTKKICVEELATYCVMTSLVTDFLIVVVLIKFILN
jgi:ABC-type uncharacterized transport system permease subunit